MNQASRRAIDLLFLLTLGTIIAGVGWIGHIASDDALYIDAARSWLADGWFVPTNHHGVRHPPVLLIAISFALFGDGEWQSILPSLLAIWSLICLVYAVAFRHGGRPAGLFAASIFVCTGLFTELGTIANADIFEAVFLLSGLVLFVTASSAPSGLKRSAWLMCAGVLLGLALVNRETAVVAVFALLLCLMLGAYTNRREYIWVAIGIVLLPLTEIIYYLAVLGDPLHRVAVVLSTHGAPQMTIVGEVGHGTGNITHNRVFGPFAAMLFNQEFMLVFWLALPAAAYLWRHGYLRRDQNGLLWLLLLTCVIWLPLNFYLLGLRPLPRYYSLPLAVAAIFTGIWIAQLCRSGRLAIGAGLLALCVVAGLFGIDVSNKSPRHAERLLAQAAQGGLEPIYTDPETHRRAANFLSWKGVARWQVLATLPPDGGLYLYVPRNADRAGAEIYRPQESWRPLSIWRGTPTVTGRILNALGLAELVAEKGLSRVLRYGQPAVLYRVATDK